jgi:hypothetical protein
MGRRGADGSVHGDFASRIRLMGTADGIFCRANDILALACKQLTLRKRWLRVSSITFKTHKSVIMRRGFGRQ